MTVLIAERESIFPSIPGEFTQRGLNLPESLPYDEWERVGKLLQTVERSVRWWIGDWLAFGERKYGEMYAQAIDATGHKVGDLMNLVYVSSSVEISRRRENLSWSHHQEVAALEPDAQDAWLDKAETEQLSTRELREQIKDKQRQAATAVLPVPKCRKCGNECAWCQISMKARSNK